MRFVILLIFINLVSCTQSFAHDHSREVAIFLDKVNDACNKTDADSFRSLFCTIPSEKSPSNAPSFFTQSGARFTGARLESSLSGGEELAHGYILLICHEPPSTKEMCQLFKVVEQDDHFCIDKDGKVNG